MSSRACPTPNYTRPNKRKRASDNSSKNEPAAKKIRRNKSDKLGKDHSTQPSTKKRKTNKDTQKINLFEKGQFYFDSDSKINNNVSSTNLVHKKNIKIEAISSPPRDISDLSTNIKNSENFQKLRELSILLDRTIVDNYFLRNLSVLLDRTIVDNYCRRKLLSKKQSRKKRRIRRLKKKDSVDNHGQKTLLHFFNINAASSQNRMIDDKAMLIPLKQKDIASEQLIPIDQEKVERVSISLKDLQMICNVRVNLKRLHPIDVTKVERQTILPTSNDVINSNAVQNCITKDCNKSQTANDVSIDESLARIKIEDVGPSSTITTDEISMKMEVSEETFGEMNFSWNEYSQPSFNGLKVECTSTMKMEEAISALSTDRLLYFYDECPDVPMEEIAVNEIVQKGSDDFDVNLVNSGSSFSSSRCSWPISDESGIFMSDDSTHFSELASKFVVNSSFSNVIVKNEVNSTK